MTSAELDKLAEKECPRLDPTRFASDEELADELCAELGIPKAEPAAAAGRDRVEVRRRDR